LGHGAPAQINAPLVASVSPIFSYSLAWRGMALAQEEINKQGGITVNNQRFLMNMTFFSLGPVNVNITTQGACYATRACFSLSTVVSAASDVCLPTSACLSVLNAQ
jgi:hypothetical protein